MWTLIIVLSVALPSALGIQGYDSGGDKGGLFSTSYSGPIGFDEDFKGLAQEWDSSDALSGHMGSGSSNDGSHFEKHDADFYGIKDGGFFSSSKSDYGKARSDRSRDHRGGYADSPHKEDSLHSGRGYGKTSGKSYPGAAKYEEGADSQSYGYADYGSPKDHDYEHEFGAKGGYAEKLGGFDSYKEMQDPSYGSHKGGYDNHKEGYDSHKGGYDSHKGGYDNHKEGYDSHKGGYDSHKGGYDNHKGGYDSHKEGHASHKGGYDSHRGGYDSHKGGYDSHKRGYDNHEDYHGVKDSHYPGGGHRSSYKEGSRRRPQEHGYGRKDEARHSRKPEYGHSHGYHRGPRSYHTTKGHGGSDHGYNRGPRRRRRYGHGEYHGTPKYGRKMAPLLEEEKEDMHRKPVDPQPEEYEYGSSDHRRVSPDHHEGVHGSGDTLDFGPDKGKIIAHSKNGHATKLTRYGVEYIPEKHHPKDTGSYIPHMEFDKEGYGQTGHGGEDMRRTGEYGRDASDRDPTKGFDHLHPKYY